MKRDAAVTIIKGRVQRANDSALDAKIVTEMQEVQKELEGNAKLPWFLLSEFLTRTTSAGEERVPLPVKSGLVEGDFLREYEGGSLWILNDAGNDWDPLDKDDFLVLEAVHGSLAKNKPKGYSLDGKYFRLKPTPDKVYTLRMRVWLRDVALSDDIENDWLANASDLLMSATAQKIARFHLRDEKQAVSFDGEIATALARLNISDEARKHTNRSYVMGGPD